MKTENNQCEVVVINGNYYSDLEEYLNGEFGSKEEIEELPDDYQLLAYECESKPIQVFTAEWIVERINEEKFSEEQAEYEYDQIIEALNKCVDFEKLNSLIPKLAYETNNQIIFTKEDLLQSF